MQEMWIQELPVVVATRQAGRIVCSIDLLSHAVRPTAVMCIQNADLKYKKPTAYTIVNFSQGIFVDLIQHWMEFVHGKIQKAVNNTNKQGSVIPSTKSKE